VRTRIEPYSPSDGGDETRRGNHDAEKEAVIEEGRAAVAAEVSVLRRQRVLADGAELDKISRYEASLERSMLRTIHELQRLQAARQGGISAPLALDVDFAAS
jgi:hypothetical protein